jgi:hypothetical protein
VWCGKGIGKGGESTQRDRERGGWKGRNGENENRKEECKEILGGRSRLPPQEGLQYIFYIDYLV